MAAEAAKCKRADSHAKAKAAQQGGPSTQPLNVAGNGAAPLTAMAEGAMAGGQLNLKTRKLEDLASRPFLIRP